MRFFTGLDAPNHAQHIDAAFVSINRIRNRKSAFAVGDWIMDSGAFTEIKNHGGYREEPDIYAKQIMRWKGNGNLLAAVSQDLMCEPFMLEKTGLTINDHQRLTIERYDKLLRCDTGVYIMPVLQGYDPADYVSHIRMYGARLTPGMWVGVGSVCKRNANIAAIAAVLLAIYDERPDLLLHGFGLKKASLASGLIVSLLHSADSMAWSFTARFAGRNQHDWREAKAFGDTINSYKIQWPLFK
jgi:hypothetical protein